MSYISSDAIIKSLRTSNTYTIYFKLCMYLLTSFILNYVKILYITTCTKLNWYRPILYIVNVVNGMLDTIDI